jgi:hypothetical protein
MKYAVSVLNQRLEAGRAVLLLTIHEYGNKATERLKPDRYKQPYLIMYERF